MSYVPSRPAAEVLLMTSDDDLAAEVALLAESVGVSVERLPPGRGLEPPDPTMIRQWAAAVAILLDAGTHLADGWHDLLARGGVTLLRLDDDPIATGASTRGEVIRLPSGRSRLLELLAAAASPPIGVVVGVSAVAGGLGASSLAVAMATRCGPTGVLVDGDPVSSGLDVLLGAEDATGLRWADLAGLESPMVTTDLAALLPSVGSLRWLSHRLDAPDPPAAAARAAVLQATRAQFEVTVLDLGRGHDLLAHTEVDVVVLLTSADVAGFAGVGRYLHRLVGLGRRVGLVLRTRPGAGLTRARAADLIDGSAVDVIATLPHLKALPGATDRGELVDAVGGRLARTADACLAWSADGPWPR